MTQDEIICVTQDEIICVTQDEIICMIKNITAPSSTTTNPIV